MEQFTSDCSDLFQQNSKRWAKTAEMTDEARVLLRMIAKALHYMHGEGWAHGDLKPENICYSGMRQAARRFA
jgi:serine/threonine protein kinase